MNDSAFDLPDLRARDDVRFEWVLYKRLASAFLVFCVRILCHRILRINSMIVLEL